MSNNVLATWHQLVEAQDPSALDTLLADDVVFHSPVVHAAQHGRALAAMYLGAALKVFFNPTFRYVREVVGPSDAMLEFETTIDGVHVNGVDILRWNEHGQVTDFKVMLRPLKAIDVVQQRMAALLRPARGSATT